MKRSPNFFGLPTAKSDDDGYLGSQKDDDGASSSQGPKSPAFVFGQFPSFSPTMRRRKSFSSTPTSSFKEPKSADPPSLSSPTSSQDSSSNDTSTGFNSIKVVIEQNEDSKDVPELHQRLRNAKTIEDLLEAAPFVTVTAACYADSLGRTAMHVLSENHFLAETIIPSYQQHLLPSPTLSHSVATTTFAVRSPHGMLTHAASSRTTSSGSTSSSVSNTGGEHDGLIDFLVQVLWPAYHAALMTTDKKGYIPFEAAIHEWVQSVYDRHMTQHRTVSGLTAHGSNSTTKIILPSILDLNVTTRWKNNASSSVHSMNSKINLTSQDGNNVETVAANSQEDVESGTMYKRSSNHDINRVKVFPKRVRISSHALYAIKMLSALLEELIGTMDAAQMLSSRSNRSGRRARERSARDNFRTTAFKDMSAAIVQTVASIPDFVKVVLFIDDEDQREELLNTTLMKHVLLSGYSVGPWLTGMLQSHDKRASALALEYLHLISAISLNEDDSEQDHIMRKEKNDQELKLRKEFYQQASRIEDFVPSLLSLGEEKIEEAATTDVVQQVLDRIISRPFAVTVVFCDALFLALLIFGYRGAANGLVLGASPASILAFIHVCNTGIFYFVVRELGKIISLCMVTRKARTYFVSFWNLVDLSTVALALASTLAIRSQMSGLRGLCAITTGLMWLRVLSYLKGINMQLATFVLAILQITRDILWFCVIMFIVIVLFSQMFFTLLAPDTCSVKETRDNLECSQNEYYLKVYAILLGDFGLFQRENFTSAFSIILAVLYTFMVVLVLLNVLIAVASDSYEKCMLRSHNLFGRARVMMVAELVSFQNLLRRSIPHRGGPSSSSPIHGGGPLYATWWSSESWVRGWSRGSVVFFSLASLVALMWTVGELVGYLTGALQGHLWLSFGSICVNVTLFVGIMMFLASGANEGGKDAESQNPIFFFRWYGQYFQQAMVRFLGSSNGSVYGANSDELVWNGRLVYLRREMAKLAEETRRDCSQMLKGVERSMHQSEMLIRTEVNGLDKCIAELLSEQREMKEQFATLLEKRRFV